jgi:hypothetical protein
VKKLHQPTRNDREFWEDSIFQSAVYFTVIRSLGGSNYHRREFPSFQEAVIARGDDPRLMIYAVAANDHSMMIAPKDYDFYLGINSLPK